MIDLTKDVSPAVLAQTAAKLEAEQKQREEDDAQKDLAGARKQFEARMVSCLQSSCLLPMCYCWHMQAQKQQVSMACLDVS